MINDRTKFILSLLIFFTIVISCDNKKSDSLKERTNNLDTTKIGNTKEIDSEKDEKKRTALERKYKKMFEGNGWISDKQTKLLREGFKEYDSRNEPAPDGSIQPSMYYRKNVDGFIVNVMLQYSYSTENHYARVWVE